MRSCFVSFSNSIQPFLELLGQFGACHLLKTAKNQKVSDRNDVGIKREARCGNREINEGK